MIVNDGMLYAIVGVTPLLVVVCEMLYDKYRFKKLDQAILSGVEIKDVMKRPNHVIFICYFCDKTSGIFRGEQIIRGDKAPWDFSFQ